MAYFWKWSVVLLTAAACVTFEDPEPATDTTSGGTTGGTVGTTTSTGTPTTGDPGEPECDPWEQDCDAGSKCTPFDSKADGVVDTTRCVKLVPSPGSAGDPCLAEGGIVGLDDCGAGLLCWFLDEDGAGICTPLCTGSPGAPMCGEGLSCDISNGGLLPLCLTTCDPLSPGCLNGQICIPSATNVFVCDSDASGDGGGYGDPCEFTNVCDPGLLCVAGPGVPGCQSAGCCSEFCDVTKPAEGQCSGAPAQQCVPYDTMDPPPGYENVGTCVIKQ